MARKTVANQHERSLAGPIGWNPYHLDPAEPPALDCQIDARLCLDHGDQC